jgi:putative hydrolase
VTGNGPLTGDQPAVDLLAGDHHVHSSTFSDDATSTIAENIAAAAGAGLVQLRLIDHVRVSTTWVPEFAAAVAAVPAPDGLTVLTGVETKLLDADGRLDLPPGDLGVDRVVIADHRFPGPDGPWSPDETRQRLSDGLAVADALDLLVGGLVAAMGSVERAQLAHCFSILPKVGLSEDDLDDERLQAWASAAARTGTLVEVNEKWGCPGPRAIRAVLDAGGTLVASTDAHAAVDVGVYGRVPLLLQEARG